MGCGSSVKKVVLPKKSGSGLLHGNLIVEHADVKINEIYNIDKKKLGQGSYGSVQKGVHRQTGVVRAVKTMPKSGLKNTERFQNEIDIMKIMDHPNIIKLYETYEDHFNIYLVLEICTGGELFDRIIDSGQFTEREAACVMKDILSAVMYMHCKMIAHRDLKPENFLFTTKDPIENTDLKVIDFGLAHAFGEGVTLTTKAGTPYYVAPQVLAGKYDNAADLWSCGVIAYVLLCGYPPFHGDTDSDVLMKVKSGIFDFPPRDWDNISADAKDLIKRLLRVSPKERVTAEKALSHEWVENKAPHSSGRELDRGMFDNLRSFRSQNKLKKAALHVIASQLSSDEIKALRDVFKTLDFNGDGLLSVKELKEGLEKGGFTELPSELQQIIEDVDADGSGEIDYTEFIAATIDKKFHIQEDVCWTAFRVFDRNGDGKISKDEIKAVLQDDDVGTICGAKEIADLITEFDANGDGEIDFAEFMEMMRKS